MRIKKRIYDERGSETSELHLAVTKILLSDIAPLHLYLHFQRPLLVENKNAYSSPLSLSSFSHLYTMPTKLRGMESWKSSPFTRMRSPTVIVPVEVSGGKKEY